ncbi:MAG: translation initiation factor, partial [Actinomycetota bacterium]
AYQVEKNGKMITFIDTPGHAAFTKMRARGAQVTDIVVLMVAADDGVMPQTIEAISHARAAEVPIVVAINKIDKDNADVPRVMAQLAEQQLTPEAWGGDTIVVEMAAQSGLGVDEMLEQLAVVAEINELEANPTGRAKGIVLEAQLDVGRGPVATVLVDKGTLKVGDPMVAGAAWGKVRAIINSRGEQIKEAGPSTPVQILGLSAVPGAGDEFRAAPDERTARTVAEAREQRFRTLSQRGDARVQRGVKLEDIFTQIQAGEVATLNVIIKADVHGSLEAVTESLRKLERDDVRAAFVHRAVGAITENDITLAAATNATLIGFNVRPDRKVRELAEAEGVEIRTYEIIYKLIEDIDKAMKGMLAPEFEEVVTGEAEVREIFRAPKVGAIAGCFVRSGVITRGSKVRFLRDGTIIWKGAISSLRRFKDDVREVREGFECGIGLSDFQDLKQGRNRSRLRLSAMADAEFFFDPVCPWARCARGHGSPRAGSKRCSHSGRTRCPGSSSRCASSMKPAATARTLSTNRFTTSVCEPCAWRVRLAHSAATQPWMRTTRDSDVRCTPRAIARCSSDRRVSSSPASCPKRAYPPTLLPRWMRRRTTS